MYIYIIYIDIISIYILVCCFRFPPCLLMILFGKNMWYSRKVLDEFGWVMFLAFFPGMFHDFGDSLKCFLGDSGWFLDKQRALGFGGVGQGLSPSWRPGKVEDVHYKKHGIQWIYLLHQSRVLHDTTIFWWDVRLELWRMKWLWTFVVVKRYWMFFSAWHLAVHPIDAVCVV